jgi:antitoxin ParD1/3/4
VGERKLAMPSPEDRTVSLPAEHADYIDALVASGAYATAEEVVSAGLLALQAAGLVALQERDGTIERWLREEVVPVAVAMRSDPDRAIPAEQVFADLRALQAQRSKHSHG